jgi:alpha-D-ribose 1-methylphosphonate 5-triphosphate synthase subunit PhnH
VTAELYDRALVAQARFRALLRALARPGIPVTLEPAERPRSVAETGYLLAVAETLLDHEVGFAVIGDSLLAHVANAFAEEVRLRTGSPPVAAAEARFVFVFGAAGGQLDELSPGSYEFPDESATLLWHVASAATTTALTLSGPGVDGALAVSLPGIGGDDLTRLARINAAYPTGLDCYLIGTDGDVVGLPRGVRWRVNEQPR